MRVLYFQLFSFHNRIKKRKTQRRCECTPRCVKRKRRLISWDKQFFIYLSQFGDTIISKETRGLWDELYKIHKTEIERKKKKRMFPTEIDLHVTSAVIRCQLPYYGMLNNRIISSPAELLLLPHLTHDYYLGVYSGRTGLQISATSLKLSPRHFKSLGEITKELLYFFSRACL